MARQPVLALARGVLSESKLPFGISRELVFAGHGAFSSADEKDRTATAPRPPVLHFGAAPPSVFLLSTAGSRDRIGNSLDSLFEPRLRGYHQYQQTRQLHFFRFLSGQPDKPNAPRKAPGPDAGKEARRHGTIAKLAA